MMKRFALVLAVFVLLILVAPAGAAHAAPRFDRTIGDGQIVDEDITVFGGSLVVEEGATINGEVSVFGGTAELAGHVNGDVSIFGGATTLAGTVDGDLVIVGGSLHLDAAADVEGECVLVGGTVRGDGQAGINCASFGDLPEIAIPAFVAPPMLPDRPSPPDAPEAPRVRHDTNGRGFFATVSSIAGQSLFLGLAALLAAAVAPRQLTQVSDALRQKPAASGAVGFLTFFAGISLVVLLAILSAFLLIVCIGILGIPIVIVLAAALFVGSILGWVAVGNLLGQRLAELLKLTNRSLVVTTALGTVALTIAAGVLSQLPFFLGGWLWSLAAVALFFAGLGAVALTRFGTRSYPHVVGGNDQKVAAVLETLPVEDVGPEPGAAEKPPAD